MPVEPVRVLVITTMADARRGGATFGTCRHRRLPSIQFWWPRLGLHLLAGREFDVVCIAVEIEPELRDWLHAHLQRRGRAETTVVEGRLW